MARQYGLAFGLVRWRQVQATRLQAYLYNKEEKDKERGINGQHDEQSVVLPFLHLGSFLPSPASPLISLPWVVVLAILRILQCLSRLSCGVSLCLVLAIWETSCTSCVKLWVIMTWWFCNLCPCSNTKPLFNSSQTPNFDTMQKEDSPSHQTCSTCMEY